MPSTIDLASRLAAVLATQQEILYAVTDAEKIMQLVVTKAPEITGGTGSAIEMVEDGRLIRRAASGTAAAHIGAESAVKESLSGTAIQQRTVVRCDDCEADPRIDAAAAVNCLAIGARSMIIAPLLQADVVVGVLETYSPRANAFDDLDSYTLQLLAGMTSAALMQANEFRERQASEQRYRLLFERNVAGVFRTTLDGQILDCNTALVEYLGYDSKEELLAGQSWDLYHERSDRERFLEQLAREHALTNFRLRLKKKDGSAMTGVLNVSMIPADKGETHVLGTLVEETEE